MKSKIADTLALQVIARIVADDKVDDNLRIMLGAVVGAFEAGQDWSEMVIVAVWPIIETIKAEKNKQMAREAFSK